MTTVATIGLAVVLVAVRPPGAANAQGSDAVAAKAAQGSAALKAGRFDEAASIYADLVVARPTDAGLRLNLGMARYMGGHPAEAVAPLRKALQISPSLASASLFLGAALLDLGRPQEAVPALQKAVTAMPSNADAREMLARGQLMLSRFSGAAASYLALTGLQPENPKSWYGIAKSYEGLAEELLAAVQRQSPDSPVLELLVADVAVTQEKFSAALAIYRRVEANPPVGGLHEAIADLYERAGKPDWAATERRKSEVRTPARCAARPGECEFLAGRFREAIAAGTRAATPAGRYWAIRSANRLATEAVAHLETLPPSIELHLIKAEIAQSRGQRPDAVREVRDALALAPGNPVIETALAEALLGAHNLDEALPLLQKLTRASPGDPALLLMFGDGLVERQQLDEAIPVLEAAVKADRSSLAARASLGRAYVQAGRYADALPHLEAAVAEDETGELHLQLARTYQALQREDEARKAMSEYQKRHQETAAPPTDAKEETLTPPE